MAEKGEWKKDRAGKTALLIKGARRVGKSTIAEEFAKNEYETYIKIDFSNVSKEVNESIEQMRLIGKIHSSGKYKLSH